jgi:phosphate transport system permease protein
MAATTTTPTDRTPDPGRQLGLGRRRRVNAAMTLLLALIMAATVAVLVWVLGYVAVQGFKYLGPEFVTSNPPGNPSDGGGGFANGIIGSLIVVGVAAALAIPLGIAAAVWLVEYGHRHRLPRVVRFTTDVLVGVPTIVTGAFIYAVWVVRFGFSGLAGGFALGLVMLPLIVRTTEEMLRLVPRDLREASLALGVTRTRTILTVVLPTAASGIITGIMLAIARAMGETAPLLLTALGNDLFTELNPTKRMSTLSLQIFGNAITGFRAAQARAWAGALTLIGIVLVLTVVARLVSRRNPLAR